MRSDQRPQLFLGIVCALGGIACVTIFWLIDASHREYDRRWAALAFGTMALIAGFQFLKEGWRQHFSAELDALLNSLARTVFYSCFGGLALGGVFGAEGRLRGGIPFIPETLNDTLGRSVFTLAGVVLCGLGLYCLAQTLAQLKKYRAVRKTQGSGY